MLACKLWTCTALLNVVICPYPHEFIYIPGKYSRYLRYAFRVWDYVFVDLVWWNIYCNGGKVMFLKKKKKKLSVFLFNLCGLFPFTWPVCCWMVRYLCRRIWQWKTDLPNIHSTEQLMVIALLIYCGEDLLVCTSIKLTVHHIDVISTSPVTCDVKDLALQIIFMN